jgi:alginate O-acetyltransferase complex protein AlgI
MSFVSYEFVVFFAAVLVGLAIMPSHAARLALLLVANVIFYGAGTPRFLLVLAIPSLVDYACAVRMEDAAETAARRQWLVLSLAVNIGVLVYFKYANFFIDTIAGALHVRTVPLDIVLPVGISFFTFKTMSYTIDVYRGRLRACRSWWRYAMFVSFFPELVAGPIVRASVFLPQMDRPIRLDWHRTMSGMRIVLMGVTKKMLVADRLSTYVDLVFAKPALYSPSAVFAAVLGYAIQIYCDFSGYSDMAIGLARIVGFDLPANFAMPYLSRSITEFWRRWHITLSEWLRDYLYIPLGGNRRGRARTYVNLMLTMLLGGLWHGANWTFVVWGLLHGIALAAHKFWLEIRPKGEAAGERSGGPIARVVGWMATTAFVTVCWVFFRAPNFEIAWTILRKLGGFAPGGIEWTYLPVYLFLPLLAGAHAIAVLHAARKKEAADGHMMVPSYATARLPLFAGAFLTTAWLLVLYLFIPLHRSPFIYFQF